MTRGRPQKPVEYENTSLFRLATAMRDLRNATGMKLVDLANESGWSNGHLSRVEHGKTLPTPEIIEYYDVRFGGDGILNGLFDAAREEHEQERRQKRQRQRALGPDSGLIDEGPEPGIARRQGKRDSSKFVADVTIPDGTIVAPGERFVKTWAIRNNGELVWKNRYLRRQGPLASVGTPKSPARVPIRETTPGEMVEISVPMQAQDLPGSSVLHWKMVYEDGALCFPEKYSAGLVVQVTVVAS